MALSKEEIIEAISNMTVLELSELVKALEEKFGVQATAPVMMGPVAAPGAAPAAQAEAEAKPEEKNEFDVVLVSFGDKKIQVIKEVRAITGLGLKEAKETVEKAPVVIKEAVPKEEAEKIKERLEAVGATVELK